MPLYNPPKSDHQSLSNLQLAQAGVTYGHIDDQAQTIAGAKTFSSVPLLDASRTITDMHHIVDKAYVDEAVTSLGMRFYMTNTGSGVTQPVTAEEYYLTAMDDPAAFDQTYADLVDAQYVVGFISPVGATFAKLIAGLYDWNIFLEKTAGTKPLRVYWTLVERKADNSEALIGTSANSNLITSKLRDRIPLILSNDYTVTAGSRIVGKIYAVVGATGSAPTLKLYGGGADDSHWEIPTNTEVLDDIYVKLAGDETIAGIKTFSSFPVTPSAAPTTNYQVANKKYVDDEVAGVTVSPAGNNTEIQFNNSGAFGASANLTWDGTKLSTPKVSVNQTNTAVVAHGAMGATETIDWSAGDIQSGTMDANCTLTFSNPNTTTMVMEITHGASAYNLTFPSAYNIGITDKSTTVYALAAGATKKSLFFIYYNGTDYYVSQSRFFA